MMQTARRWSTYVVVAALALTGAVVDVTPSAGAETVRQSTVWFGGSAEQQMTVFTPTTGHSHPAVLFVHGGAWRRSWALSSELTFGRDLAVRTGWVVAVADYNATSTPGWEIQPRDIVKALDTLRNTSAVNPNRVALWGESAGANLSLIVAYRYPGRVRAVVSVSGPTDIRYEYWNGPNWLRADVRWFERGAPSTHPYAYLVTSPVRHVQPGLPPTLLATSKHDPIVPPAQQPELCNALHAAGDTCRLVEVAGHDHSSRIEPETVIGSSRTVRGMAIRFLAQRLNP